MTTPTSLEVGVWIGCLGAVVWVVNQLFKLNHWMKGNPPKPPNEQLSESHQALTQRVEELERQRKDHDTARRLLYEHIDKVRLEVKQDIQKMDEKVDQIPNTIIVLLKNTGALKR